MSDYLDKVTKVVNQHERGLITTDDYMLELGTLARQEQQRADRLNSMNKPYVFTHGTVLLGRTETLYFQTSDSLTEFVDEWTGELYGLAVNSGDNGSAYYGGRNDLTGQSVWAITEVRCVRLTTSECPCSTCERERAENSWLDQEDVCDVCDIQH